MRQFLRVFMLTAILVAASNSYAETVGETTQQSVVTPIAAPVVVQPATMTTVTQTGTQQGTVTTVQTIPGTIVTPLTPADAVTTAVTTSVQPQAQPTVPVALTAADYLDIQYKPGDSKLKFKEYNLSVNNKQARHVQILQLEVVNGLSEQAYGQMRQEHSQAKRRVAGGMLRGITGLATSFIPYAGVGSVVAYQAIGAGTNVAYSAANAIQSAPVVMDYTGHIVQRASDIMISPNQQFQCLAVVPNNQQPAVKVIFKDLQTNQIFDIQK